MSRAAVVLAVMVMLGSACSLITSLDGYTSSGQVVYVPIEGGSADGASTDATVYFDAGADAPPILLAPCPPGAFCRDFDDVGAPGDNWEVSSVKKGTLGLDHTTFVTPGASFASEVEAGNDYFAAAVRHDYPFVLTRGTFRFWAYIDKWDAASYGLTVFDVFVPNGSNGCSDRLYLSPTITNLVEEISTGGNLSTVQHRVSIPPPFQTWFEVRVEIDLGTKKTSLYFDDQLVVGDVSLTCAWTGASTESILGIYFSNGQTGQRVLFDHVVFDVK